MFCVYLNHESHEFCSLFWFMRTTSKGLIVGTEGIPGCAATSFCTTVTWSWQLVVKLLPGHIFMQTFAVELTLYLWDNLASSWKLFFFELWHCSEGVRVVCAVAASLLITHKLTCSTWSLKKVMNSVGTLEYLIAEQDQISAQGWNFS